MFIFLTILFCVVLYLVAAGATHGYAKHRWPPQMTRKWSSDVNGYVDADENSGERGFATVFWPFYWAFIWPFTKVNEVTFSNIEKRAAKQVARNKARIVDLHATKAQVEESNAELEQAEVELEKEIAKL